MFIFLASVSCQPPSVSEEHPHPVRSALASNPSQGLCFDLLLNFTNNIYYHTCRMVCSLYCTDFLDLVNERLTVI